MNINEQTVQDFTLHRGGSIGALYLEKVRAYSYGAPLLLHNFCKPATKPVFLTEFEGQIDQLHLIHDPIADDS